MTNITAKIIADSVSAINERRITTFELEYPRFIHSEFMTHRMISKNSASSRAIPVKAMLDNIQSNPAIPCHWGKNQAGMQANEEHNAEVMPLSIIFALQAHLRASEKDVIAILREKNPDAFSPKGAWLSAQAIACNQAEEFANAGYHKQIVNRLTEPFQMIKVVATATEWDNFFWLRKHADAQPEIRILAEKMWQAMQDSVPETLYPDEWHTPYVDHERDKNGTLIYKTGGLVVSSEVAVKISSSMCAQVSYRKADESLEKALTVYKRLVESKPVHASPFEHQATPMPRFGNFTAASVLLNNIGVTALNKRLGYMSGNLVGWIQYRQLIDGHTCWNYENE